MDQACPLEDVWVLLVEDEPSIAKLFTWVLEDAGAQVITVSSGTAALKTLAAFVPHVLISDIGLPDMDGRSLLVRVRALEAERGIQRIPAIAITGYDAAELELEGQAQATAARFQKYLSKPIELKELVAAVVELNQPQKQ
ncbi:response regulator [Trichocoleus desertorum AS-A10]|uniref:response regulator n=1 Tax=Trichocoleus desertorum TaxID=1481672 RepID=UPI003297A986